MNASIRIISNPLLYIEEKHLDEDELNLNKLHLMVMIRWKANGIYID